MQSRNENEVIKRLAEVDLSNIADLEAKIKQAQEMGAVSHTIGKLPKQGDNVTIYGLSYRVEFADFVKGKFNVKLVCRDK